MRPLPRRLGVPGGVALTGVVTELFALLLAPVEGRAEPEQQRPTGRAAASQEGGLPQHPSQPFCQPLADLGPGFCFRRRCCGGQKDERRRARNPEARKASFRTCKPIYPSISLPKLFFITFNLFIV